MATEADKIQADSGLGGLTGLLQLFSLVKGADGGTQTTTETGGPETVSNSSSSGSSVSTPGDLGPLREIFAQQTPLGTMEGLLPIVNAIFSEGSKELPGIYSRAGASGSRVQNNSIVAQLQNQLLAELTNKAALMLSANQQAAAKTAEAIAAQGRRTSSSQSSSSTSTTVQKPRTQTTKTTGKSGVLGQNGLSKLAMLLAGGSAVANAGKLTNLASSFFSGGGGDNLGAGLSLNAGGVGLQPTDNGIGLLPGTNFSFDALASQFPGLNPVGTDSSMLPTLAAGDAGLGLQLPTGGGLGEVPAGTTYDFDPTTGEFSFAPTDFSTFGDFGNLGFDVGGLGLNVPTLPTGTDLPDVSAADFQPTDFSNFGVDFGGQGLKPEDFADFFGGAFADGGSLGQFRGGARYNTGQKTALDRTGAINTVPARVSFTGSKSPALTTVTKPVIPQTVTQPNPLTREEAYADYRKQLMFQELYGTEDKIGSWRDWAQSFAELQQSDPRFTGTEQLDAFGRTVLDEAGKPVLTGGFNQEAAGGEGGSMGQSLFTGAYLLEHPNERQYLAKDMAELARIRQLIPVSTTIEGARKLFGGIEKLPEEIQQAIADDPRRYAAGTRGLLAFSDTDAKTFLDKEWTNYGTSFGREGNYSYYEGREGYPFKGTGKTAARWHPQYGLMVPSQSIQEDTSKFLSILAPVLGVASMFYPGLAPFAGMAQTANAADKGDDLGAALGALGTVGGAAGLSGATGFQNAIRIGTGIVKLGDAYFKYQDYQDYLDKLDKAQKAGGDTGAVQAPTPVDPGTNPEVQQFVNQNVSQAIRSAAGKAQAVPLTERIMGENSVLSEKNIAGVGSPAYAPESGITLDNLEQFMNQAQSINGVTTPVPGKADGGRMPIRLQMIDRLVETGSTRAPKVEIPPANYGGSLSRDEEMAKFRGTTPAQVEAERQRKLQDALKRRKVPRITGAISAPGDGTVDTTLIAAANNEYMLPADVVDFLGGPGMLDDLLAQLHTPVRS